MSEISEGKETVRLEITFVRHAQSLYNAGLADVKNCPLSPKGCQEASLLGGEFDLLVLSPLKRAIQTYAFSQIKAGEIVVSPLARENKTRTLNLLDGECDPPAGGWETGAEVQIRSLSLLNWLKERAGSSGGSVFKVGVVSHHDFLRDTFGRCFGVQKFFRNCEAVSVSFPVEKP